MLKENENKKTTRIDLHFKCVIKNEGMSEGFKKFWNSKYYQKCMNF